MTNTITYPEVKPDYAANPGEILADVLKDHNASTCELAAELNLTPYEIEKLLSGEMEFSQEIADKIEELYDVPAYMWKILEDDYQEIHNNNQSLQIV